MKAILKNFGKILDGTSVTLIGAIESFAQAPKTRVTKIPVKYATLGDKNHYEYRVNVRRVKVTRIPVRYEP